MIFLYAAIYVAVVVQISNLCTTIYLHRYMSHHALKLHPSVAMAMQFWLWLHTAIDPREWVAVHRKHHQFPDEHGDPHSPKLEGLWKVLLTNAYLYRKEAANPETVARYTRDIRTNRVEDFMHRQGYLGLFLGVLAAGVLLGPIAGIASFLIPGGRLRLPQRHDQRSLPRRGLQELPQHRHQPALGGLDHRRRGAAQQPPPCPVVPQAEPSSQRDRPGVARDPPA